MSAVGAFTYSVVTGAALLWMLSDRLPANRGPLRVCLALSAWWTTVTATCSWLRPAILARAVISILTWMVLFFGAHDLAERLFGTHVSQTVTNTPHPFSFEWPRFWEDVEYEAGTDDEPWRSSIRLPSANDDNGFASLYFSVRAKNGWYIAAIRPVITSLDDLVQFSFPVQHNKILSSTAWVVDSRPAREVASEPLINGTPYSPPMLARAVFFEDRGYYYMIEYSATHAEYDRYSGAYYRAVQTFRFLD